MSAIEKLAICGVRSFDPQGSNVIEFTPPLTLIVGHNGAGKTVISLQQSCVAREDMRGSSAMRPNSSRLTLALAALASPNSS